MEETDLFAYWLFTVPGLGSTVLRRITKWMRPRDIWEMAETLPKEVAEGLSAKKREALQEHARRVDPWANWEKLKKTGFRFTHLGAEDYPERLSLIPDPPYGLIYGGRLPQEQNISAALIGARDCTEYGRSIAIRMGKALANSGIDVISGMARGVDGIGQSAALGVGGYSLGVLGCGADLCYPESNRELYERLLQQGGVLSEYPLGAVAKPGYFPLRNRVISGLSDYIIVIEARERSGTIITVDQALEQGKDVFVVPGRITDPLSEGCNRLIRQGAGIVLSIEDLLEEMEERAGKTLDKRGGPKEEGTVLQAKDVMDLLGMERRIYDLLDYDPRGCEEIIGNFQVGESISFGEAIAALTNLCLKGLVGQKMGRYYRL